MSYGSTALRNYGTQSTRLIATPEPAKRELLIVQIDLSRTIQSHKITAKMDGDESGIVKLVSAACNDDVFNGMQSGMGGQLASSTLMYVMMCTHNIHEERPNII